MHAHVKKRLERGWRKTHNVRKEHGAVQCKARSLPLSPSLFFKYFPHGFLRETKELYSPLSLARSLPSLSSLSLPFLPSLFLWLHFCHFLFFYSPSLSPWLFCSIAKMGPQSVTVEPLNSSERPCQYAHLIYPFYLLIYLFFTLHQAMNKAVVL